MIAVIQRVTEASVIINSSISSQIKNGLVILLGIGNNDDLDDMDWLINKIINLRIFNDSQDIMNLSGSQINAEYLIISQFTLLASTKKGNRPSYINASKPEIAEPIYNQFVDAFKKQVSENKVKTGVFGADMKVSLINDGPVTIIIDTKNKV